MLRPESKLQVLSLDAHKLFKLKRKFPLAMVQSLRRLANRVNKKKGRDSKFKCNPGLQY